MSYQEFMNNLMSTGVVGAVTILDPNGAVYWASNPDWAVDGPAILSAWANKEPSIMVAGTKFSTIVSDHPENFVGRNLAGGGTVVICKSPNNYFFLTWTSGDSGLDPRMQIHVEVARMAALFK